MSAFYKDLEFCKAERGTFIRLEELDLSCSEEIPQKTDHAAINANDFNIIKQEKLHGCPF